LSPSLFSSDSSLWETPAHIMEQVQSEFALDLDVCASIGANKLERYFSPGITGLDGLSQSWSGERCWMNPPYGRGQIDKWMQKANEELVVDDPARIVVALVPARTDTKWWHEHIVQPRHEVRFIKGRLNFLMAGKPIGTAPFPSALIVMVPRWWE
jgi:phage N-6-adenine-methyltransferase